MPFQIPSAFLVLSLMGSLEKDGWAGTFLSPVVYQGLELPAMLKDHICSNMHDITEVEVTSWCRHSSMDPSSSLWTLSQGGGLSGTSAVETLQRAQWKGPGSWQVHIFWLSGIPGRLYVYALCGAIWSSPDKVTDNRYDNVACWVSRSGVGMRSPF